MKAAIGIALLTVVAVASAYPRNVRNSAQANQLSQEAPNQPTQLADLITSAQNNINNFGTEIQERLNLPDQQTVINIIKEESTSLTTKVRAYMTQVTEDLKAKSPELESLWGDFRNNLNKVVENMNAQIPNAQEQVAQLQTKFNEGVSILVKESDKAAKAISSNSATAQEDIAKFTKQAIEIAVQSTEHLNNQLQAAAAKAA